MKLIKTKGIVIKEVQYSDNDKIITLLTDSLGLVTCMAKGAKKTKSPLLASSQYLVYSEFILFKGTSFYHINSATVISTFYKLRTDFDKLTNVFEVTKLLNTLTEENMDTNVIIKLFLNTLHILETTDKNYILDVFRIRMLVILGFGSNIIKCHGCQGKLKESKDVINYNFYYNYFLCKSCKMDDKNRYLKLAYKSFMNISYIMFANMSNIFALVLEDKEAKEINKFAEYYVKAILTNI